MAIPTKLLRDDESVAVDLHPHWSLLVRPVAVMLVAIAAGIAVLVVTDGETVARTVGGAVAVAALVAAIVWLAGRYLAWTTTSFVVTDDRIVSRSGVFARRSVEIPLERINAVHLRQSPLQRLVGSGELVVDVGGDAGRQRFTDIRRPSRVQREIHRQLDENHRRRETAVRQTHAAGDDVATRLDRLAGMYERGTLTEQEFLAQKRRVLERW